MAEDHPGEPPSQISFATSGKTDCPRHRLGCDRRCGAQRMVPSASDLRRGFQGASSNAKRHRDSRMPRTGVGSPPSDPTQALRRSGVLFVREESGIRLDLQLADVGFDESAIQRTVEIELEPGRICTAGLNASFRTKSRSNKARIFP